MTINIEEQPIPRFFVNYAVPELSEWRLRIISEWSGRPVQEDGVEIEFALERPTITNDRYTEFDFSILPVEASSFDLQGWYKYYLEGSDDGIEWTEIETGTVKVINDSPKQLQEQTKYIGPNPNAEAYVIY